MVASLFSSRRSRLKIPAGLIVFFLDGLMKKPAFF
jgi:hypothetical protein